MLLAIEGRGANLGEGMWAIDFQPRHSTDWRFTKLGNTPNVHRKYSTQVVFALQNSVSIFKILGVFYKAFSAVIYAPN